MDRQLQSGRFSRRFLWEQCNMSAIEAMNRGTERLRRQVSAQIAGDCQGLPGAPDTVAIELVWFSLECLSGR
jgi:hypothetical protein